MNSPTFPVFHVCLTILRKHNSPRARRSTVTLSVTSSEPTVASSKPLLHACSGTHSVSDSEATNARVDVVYQLRRPGEGFVRVPIHLASEAAYPHFDSLQTRASTPRSGELLRQCDHRFDGSNRSLAVSRCAWTHRRASRGSCHVSLDSRNSVLHVLSVSVG